MTSTTMTWADFYLICFAIGFCFSFFSFVLGGSRFGRGHLPHIHAHSAPHLPAAHGPVVHAPVAHAPSVVNHTSAAASGSAESRGPNFVGLTGSPLQFRRLSAFLAWFCGM